ncbi:MAG TPA: hypothetical protein VFI84_00100, partial [Candidatus Saccharimonadales bacterium]|nr:hypothetical protein [Candidatus Saccharimonadales bacterium]
ENSFAITGGKTSLRTTWGGADFFVGATGTYSTAASLGVSTAWVGQIAAFRVNTPATSTLSVDMVNGSGTPIASPGATMGSATTSFSCNTVTGALATSSQKIRVTNSTTNPAWSVSVGATGGAASVWSTGTFTYDFNDSGGSGCSDGDADGHAGQLSFVPASISATAQPGCTNSGLSLLAATTAFTATNSVTLASAANASTTDTACFWDVSGINLSQTIPPGQHSGTYSLSLTITVVAN